MKYGNRMRLLKVLFLSLPLLSSGCGYTTGRLLPAHYRTIYVEPFTNKIPITEEVSERYGFQTSLPGLEEKVTRGVIDRFLFDGNLRITTKPEQADLLLNGSLIGFSRQPIRQLDDDTVEEYRLNLASVITVREPDGKALFREQGLIGDATYFVSGPSAKSESSAVDDLVTDVSRRVV
ncbi:MAG: hypothetical protein HYZ90_04835, partial [Candidatus Omnitrophica bacterium]|nr:hypothetical protein [Candidatus Omnitrophota bacterium]